MAAICIDVFSPPATEWRGQAYNALIVWVDRFSGWVGAVPTTKEGLTAEKTAHLMLDQGFGIFGLPQVIYSDQGPNFAKKMVAKHVC